MGPQRPGLQKRKAGFCSSLPLQIILFRFTETANFRLNAPGTTRACYSITEKAAWETLINLLESYTTPLEASVSCIARHIGPKIEIDIGVEQHGTILVQG